MGARVPINLNQTLTEEEYCKIGEIAWCPEELAKLHRENFDMKVRLQAAEAHAKEAESLKTQLEKLSKENFDLKACLQVADKHAKEAESLKAELEKLKNAPESDEEEDSSNVSSFDMSDLVEGRFQLKILSQGIKQHEENLELEGYLDLLTRLQVAEEHAKEAESLNAELEKLKNAPPPKLVIDPALQKRVAELEEELTESNQLVQTLINENKHYRDHVQQVSAENREELAKLHKENFDMKVRLQVAEGRPCKRRRIDQVENIPPSVAAEPVEQ